MTPPVQYRTRRIPEVGLCLVCDLAAVLVRDHCHQHGWVRGLICASCNTCLGFFDRGKTAGVSELREAFIAHFSRCPECPVWSAEVTGPSELEARVNIRLGWQFYVALKAAADDHNQSPASLIRDVITGWLTREGYLG